MAEAERRPLPYAWPEVRARLQADLTRLLPALGIQETARAGVVTPRNPTRTDRHPGSFVIWTASGAAGAWRDYATGEAGDVIDLVGYLLGLRERIDAYWWALEYLGLERGRVRTAEADETARRAAERDRLAALAKAEKLAAEKSAALFAHWLTLPPIAGTVAEVYLRETRRIPLERLAHAPGALRFERRAEHHDAETGEVTEWPCLVSVMTKGSKPAGLHRTWLAPDGSGKAPVSKAKKMFGSAAGAAIRLAPGPSGLSPAKAEAKGRQDPLAIGEGIETCLTVAAARPDYRVWAAGSLSLMGLLPWPACASAVVLLQDNDWKPEAKAAFARIAARWREMSAGRPLAIAASAVGSDFNDWATEERTAP